MAPAPKTPTKSPGHATHAAPEALGGRRGRSPQPRRRGASAVGLPLMNPRPTPPSKLRPPSFQQTHGHRGRHGHGHRDCDWDFRPTRRILRTLQHTRHATHHTRTRHRTTGRRRRRRSLPTRRLAALVTHRVTARRHTRHPTHTRRRSRRPRARAPRRPGGRAFRRVWQRVGRVFRRVVGFRRVFGLRRRDFRRIRRRPTRATPPSAQRLPTLLLRLTAPTGRRQRSKGLLLHHQLRTRRTRQTLRHTHENTRRQR